MPLNALLNGWVSPAMAEEGEREQPPPLLFSKGVERSMMYPAQVQKFFARITFT